MKKTSKILTSSIAFTLVMTFTSGSIFATKEGSTETNVAYDNRNVIPDPEHPEDPDWAVIVPKTITFKEKDDRVSVDVTIVKKNGELPTAANPASVSVSSMNGYLLEFEDQKLDYSLVYERVSMKENNGIVGDLYKDKELIEGAAILNQAATKTGLYEDTLTYRVSVK